MNNKKKPQTEEEKASMKQPFPSKRCPSTMKLQPGKSYLYCACGLTNNQPFCDDSHIGTIFTPIHFVAKNIAYSSICLCRHANPTSLPYCDGSHNDLDF